MNAEVQTPEAASADAEASVSLLDQAIAATTQSEPDDVKDLLNNLTEQALSGALTWDRNLTVTIERAVKAIDASISKQLSTIMHDNKFQKLEGSWRGLTHLVMNSETGSGMKIRVFNASKKEVYKDLDKAVEFDQSQLFKKLYESEFGSAGGEPYGTLIGDYQFSNHPEDIELLTNISHIAASAFCPFISAADPALFGMSSFTDLSKPRDLEKIFESPEYIPWRSFRDSEDARFVNLVMPSVLSRLPYGEATKPVEAFNFEEFELDENGQTKPAQHNDYTWMNAAYVAGTTLTKAFAETGWCTAIRGAEGGGKVEGLPSHVFKTDDGDTDQKCPTEIAITDRREAELSKLGFLPLCHYKNTDYSVFFGAQSVQKPKVYDSTQATENAAISARLPYIMATARIGHYLKVMARDKIGTFLEAKDAEIWLNKWISGYVNGNAQASAEMKARFPLAEATIEVKETPGAPGSYNAVAYLRPWLQMEELTASLRMVTTIPKAG